MKKLFVADTRLKTVIIIILAVAILILLFLTARNLQVQSRKGSVVGDTINSVPVESLERSSNVEGATVDTTATPSASPTTDSSPSGVINE